MSLNTGKILTIAFDAVQGAASLKMHAMSGFTLAFMCKTVWAQPGQSIGEPGNKAAMSTFKKGLADTVMSLDVYSLNTWQSYVSGIERAAEKFGTYLAADADFLAIRDMGEDDAVEAVRVLFEGVNVVTGDDIRAWGKSDGFEPLDKEAIAAALKAKRKADAKAKAMTAAALFAASMAADSSTIEAGAETVEAKPYNALDAILAAIAMLPTEADAQLAMLALNERLTAFAAPETVAPVLPDHVVPDAGSTLALLVA